MEKVHALMWLATGEIDGVYLDYERACRIAEEANKRRTWRHRLHEALAGRTNKWVVKSFDVKD